MRLTVVTPVGPGHEAVARDCAASVGRAWAHDPGPFTLLRHDLRDDTRGHLGRSRARNLAVAARPDADWFFFLDADDLMEPRAFGRFGEALGAAPDLAAVFGAVCTDRDGVVAENVYPLDWPALLERGAAGTLSMGCFVRGDAARAVPFDESMDAAEDFDFYLRLLHGRQWAKLALPLAVIRRDVPSAGGPRGYATLDWRGACRAVVDRWKP